MEAEVQGTGVFSMDVVHKILALSSLEDAKQLAKTTIAECTKKVQKANVLKANTMVDKAKDVQTLAFGMSNFILAFQGEKVIK